MVIARHALRRFETVRVLQVDPVERRDGCEDCVTIPTSIPEASTTGRWCRPSSAIAGASSVIGESTWVARTRRGHQRSDRRMPRPLQPQAAPHPFAERCAPVWLLPAGALHEIRLGDDADHPAAAIDHRQRLDVVAAQQPPRLPGEWSTWSRLQRRGT